MTELNAPPATRPEDYLADIARVRAGDQAAARELVEQLYPMVVRIARAHLPRRMSEEDLTQEIFMKMFTRLEQFRGNAPFSHWVSRIAVTTCVNHLRAQKCRPELRRADLSEREAALLDDVPADRSEQGPGEALAARELVEMLLAQLKPEDRLVLVLFDLQQKTIAEICVITGWSFELVKMRAFRARRKLRRIFEGLRGFDGVTRLRIQPPKLVVRRGRRVPPLRTPLAA